MGITKTEGFTNEVTKMAALFKVIGHPARLCIAQMIAESNSCNGSYIVENVPLAQPTISRHIAELNKAGLITISSKGKESCYNINTEAWALCQKTIATLIQTNLSSGKTC